ncbi:MAG: class I SAM-dependent methyltransferase [Actinomycetota bacterium]
MSSATSFYLPWVHSGRSPGGVPLPPRRLRMGGEHFASDADFVAAGIRDVNRLVARAGLGSASRLLDWGCGAGRLAVGVCERFGRIAEYHGVEVQRRLVRWAQRHIGSRPGFRFTFADQMNARYNPAGRPERAIPAASAAYDVFYAYSVFSHLTGVEATGYLTEVHRLLRPGGRAFITAFVEEGVEDEVQNPPGYGPLAWTGPLHCVRFSRSYFEDAIAAAGLTIGEFDHGRETDGQSSYVLVADAYRAA